MKTCTKCRTPKEPSEFHKYLERIKNYATPVFTAALLAMAFLTATSGKATADSPIFDSVARHALYDIGRHQIPQGKANVLVVYSARWCTPCKMVRPTLAALRLEGYKVVVIDVDAPHKNDLRWDYQTSDLVDQLSKILPNFVPTFRWYNSESKQLLPHTIDGVTSPEKLKEHLWKP